jgi:prepilin-type N-terminal cleavage/methylation domain-containing protein
MVGRHSGGFTLIELVVCIVLMGILAAVGANMMSASFTTTRMVDADNGSVGQARYALERLAREIREVKYVSSGVTGNYCINTGTWSATNLQFQKTVSGTPSTTCGTSDTTVTINNTGSNLSLQYSSPAVTSLLSSQATLALSYLQNDGVTTATSTSNIRFVVISLTVSDTTSGLSLAQQTRVALRNQ